MVNTFTATARDLSHARRARRRRALAIFAGVVAALTVVAIAMAAFGAPRVVASIDDEAAYKATHDTDPHLPLTAFQQQMLTLKEQAVAELFATAGGGAAPAAVARSGDRVLRAGPIPTSDSVVKNQVPQARSYWCGPATIREALGQCGFAITQANAAAELGTTVSGTPWSGGSTRTGFPMPDVMNAHQSRNYYVPKAVAYPPTSLTIQQYKANLVATIYNYNSPVIGNAWTTPNSKYYLNGHPTTADIKHWFDIRGYSETGGFTHYEDSVSGSDCGISWAWRVPAYSKQASNQIVWIVSDRGYVW